MVPITRSQPPPLSCLCAVGEAQMLAVQPDLDGAQEPGVLVAGRVICPPPRRLAVLLPWCMLGQWDAHSSFQARRLERGLDLSNLAFNSFSSSKWLKYTLGVSPYSSVSARVLKA